MTVFRRGSPNGGIECRGTQKSRLSTIILLRHALSTLRPQGVISTVLQDRGKLMTLIAGSKPRSLLFAGDGRRSVYDKKPHRYVEDNRTEFNCTHC